MRQALLKGKCYMCIIGQADILVCHDIATQLHSLNKHETLVQCCFNAGSASWKVGQHQNKLEQCIVFADIRLLLMIYDGQM